MKHIFNILLISAMSLIFFACQGDEDVLSDQIGYLTVSLEQSKDVNTKAAYNAKQMHVVIKDEKGVIKFETQDHTADLEGKQIPLKQGKYTIEAQSSGYDNQSGGDRAYYVGRSEVNIVKGQVASAKVVCSLANVKVTVAFEQSFLDKLGTGNIKVQITSKSSSAKSVDFSENRDKQVTYFPVGDLTVSYTITSKEGKVNYDSRPIENVKAKDHYILNFKNQTTGTGGVTVTVDPTMHQYTYDFTVDPTKESSALISANAWSKIAYLTAKDITVDNIPALKFQYRQKSTEQWTDVESTPQMDAKTVTATLKGLTAATTYEYQLTNGTDSYAKGEFTTETELDLQNAGFEDWYKASSVWYPASQSAYEAKTYLWDTSNPGGGAFGFNPTVEDAEIKHGGSKSAKLETQYAVIKLAAASLYTGQFVNLIGTKGAVIEFGKPFNSRPIALKGWYQYSPQIIDDEKKEVGNSGVLKKGDTDLCSIYIALAKKSYQVDNTNLENTGIKFDTDPDIIAYGELPASECVNTNKTWKELNIPLKYKNLTDVPTHIIVVCSSSKYGDYFTGAIGSTLHVDDLSLIYDGEPTLWE